MGNLRLVLILLAAGLMAGCSEVPLTGRRQLNLVPDSLINSMSAQNYNQFLAQSDVVTGTEGAETVKEVGGNIRDAVVKYSVENNVFEEVQDYDWQFSLVEDPNINAWAMPGGKVVVYTGLLELTQNDAQLAAVVGHEIAHVVAEHGSERMSQALLVDLGGMALSQALSSSPAATQRLFMRSYGLGTQVGILLPYSRQHETEADRLGTIFMAMAGYDPEAAVEFWQVMASRNKGGAIELLSTHPADATRIENLRAFLPEARRHYKK